MFERGRGGIYKQAAKRKISSGFCHSEVCGVRQRSLMLWASSEALGLYLSLTLGLMQDFWRPVFLFSFFFSFYFTYIFSSLSQVPEMQSCKSGSLTPHCKKYKIELILISIFVFTCCIRSIFRRLGLTVVLCNCCATLPPTGTHQNKQTGEPRASRLDSGCLPSDFFFKNGALSFCLFNPALLVFF